MKKYYCDLGVGCHETLIGHIRKSLKGVWLAAAGVKEQKPLVEEARLMRS
jgi:hypothetical protein